MENEQNTRKLHCLVLTYPRGGHINPLLHFSNRLIHQGLKVTFVTTRFCQNALIQNNVPKSIALETISDGYDKNGGFEKAESIKAYFARFWEIGPKSFSDLLQKFLRSKNPNPIDCVIYDSFLPWALDVAKKFDLICVAFLTQSLFVTCVNLHANKGNLKLPVCEETVSLPGLPILEACDLPSFLFVYGSNPSFFDLVVGKQFSNTEMADWVLCNSFYELEKEVADYLIKIWPKLKTVGPTIPSKFLDKQFKEDEKYGINLCKSEECLKWMDNKPKGSIVYISFGSYSTLNEEQMEEVAFALQESTYNFLWVINANDECKIPKFEKNSEKGLVITWCSQLKVLEHESLGCFVTHCGWNSTLEALSLGVPMICMPQWTDQSTNAKLVEDIWKIGLRVKMDDKGICRKDALKHAMMEIIEGEIGISIKRNAIQLKNLAIKAVDKGGSSNINIGEFVDSLVC